MYGNCTGLQTVYFYVYILCMHICFLIKPCGTTDHFSITCHFRSLFTAVKQQNVKRSKRRSHVSNVSHQQPHLYMLAVLTPWVHQFTPLLKMAADQALVPASLPSTFKKEKKNSQGLFHTSLSRSSTVPNYLNGGNTEEDRQQGERNMTRNRVL